MKNYLLYNEETGAWSTEPMTIEQIRKATGGCEVYIAEVMPNGSAGQTIKLKATQTAQLLPKVSKPAAAAAPQAQGQTAPARDEDTNRLLRMACRLFFLMVVVQLIAGGIVAGIAVAGNPVIGASLGAGLAIAIALVGRTFISD